MLHLIKQNFQWKKEKRNIFPNFIFPVFQMPFFLSPHRDLSPFPSEILRCQALDTSHLWSLFLRRLVENAVVHGRFASYCTYQFSGSWFQFNPRPFLSAEFETLSLAFNRISNNMDGESLASCVEVLNLLLSYGTVASVALITWCDGFSSQF